MERFIAQRNIDHYRELLSGDLAPDERDVIERLLAEEEANLKDLLASNPAPQTN